MTSHRIMFISIIEQGLKLIVKILKKIVDISRAYNALDIFLRCS